MNHIMNIYLTLFLSFNYSKSVNSAILYMIQIVEYRRGNRQGGPFPPRPAPTSSDNKDRETYPRQHPPLTGTTTPQCLSSSAVRSPRAYRVRGTPRRKHSTPVHPAPTPSNIEPSPRVGATTTMPARLLDSARGYNRKPSCRT